MSRQLTPVEEAEFADLANELVRYSGQLPYDALYRLATLAHWRALANPYDSGATAWAHSANGYLAAAVPAVQHQVQQPPVPHRGVSPAAAHEYGHAVPAGSQATTWSAPKDASVGSLQNGSPKRPWWKMKRTWVAAVAGLLLLGAIAGGEPAEDDGPNDREIQETVFRSSSSTTESTAPPATLPPTTAPLVTAPPETAPPPATVPPTAPPATVPPAPEPLVPQNTGCDPNYGGCVPIDSDVDCAGGSGNGPSYANGPIPVLGSDIYDLDSNGDGVACEP